MVSGLNSIGSLIAAIVSVASRGMLAPAEAGAARQAALTNAAARARGDGARAGYPRSDRFPAASAEIFSHALALCVLFERATSGGDDQTGANGQSLR